MMDLLLPNCHRNAALSQVKLSSCFYFSFVNGYMAPTGALSLPLLKRHIQKAITVTCHSGLKIHSHRDRYVPDEGTYIDLHFDIVFLTRRGDVLADSPNCHAIAIG
jgi:hypothetical protein